MPVANTQTYRQLLANSIVKPAWNTIKPEIPKDASAADKNTMRKESLATYNKALKRVCELVMKDSGIKNANGESNRNALRSYVIERLEDNNWCKKMTEVFISACKEGMSEE